MFRKKEAVKEKTKRKKSKYNSSKERMLKSTYFKWEKKKTFNYIDFKNNEQQDNREMKKTIKSAENRRDSGRFDVGVAGTITRFVLDRYILKWP